MRLFNFITLLSILACNLQAQVRIYYQGNLAGRLVPSEVAAIQVNNYTGVDIDYIYKGWATDSEGNEVLRIQSEVLTQGSGSANYHQRDTINGFGKIEVDFKILIESIDLTGFSGSLTLHSELVHPLESTSVIARLNKEIWLKNGIVANAQGDVLLDDRLVHINFKHNYYGPFELEKLPEYFGINNEMGFSFCKPFSVKIQQGPQELYAASIDHYCIEKGQNNPGQEQWHVSKNTYSKRDLEAPLLLAYSFGKLKGSRPVLPTSHALHDDRMEKYKSEALGISIDFVHHAQIRSVPSPADAVLVFDKKGAVENVETLEFDRRVSPLGINFPYGFGLGRLDVNGAVQLTVYDYHNFNEEEWLSFLAYLNNVDAEDIKQVEASGIDLWYPQELYNQRKLNNRIVSLETFTFGIRDGNRVTFVELSKVLPDPGLINYPRPRYKMEKEALLASFNYYGMGLSLKKDEKGKISELRFSNESNLAEVDVRKESLAKYIRYQKILDKKNQNTNPFELKQSKVDFQELDSLVNLLKEKKPILPHYLKITPEYDPLRKYAQFSWDSMQVAFMHRVSDGVDRIPFSNRFYESYILNWQDSVLSHFQSGGPKNTTLKEGERKVAFWGDLLQLKTTSDQRITITLIEKGKLLPRDMKAIAAFEMSNPVQLPPGILQKKVDTWTFYVSERKANSSKQMERTNLFFLETEKAVYRIKISGGFESDIPYFLNHLEIEGKQLQFEF